MKNKIRYYMENLGWTEWFDLNSKHFIPDLIEAVEISEYLTLEELKEHFPEEYAKLSQLEEVKE